MGDFNYATLRNGDIIEILRDVAHHWVLYTGKGYVVHLAHSTKNTAGSGSFFASSGDVKTMVKKERLEFIPGFSRVRVNNKYDSRYRPRPGGDIIREAEKMVDEVLPYPVTPKTCERFVAALRYNMPFTDQFPEPHRGDLLEFPRDRFTHWGLYMGDGYVIHLAPIGGGGGRVLSGYFSSATSSHAHVLKELLKDVAGPGLDYRVQNKDQIHPPLPVDAIMQEAEAKIGTVVGYSFPSRNCEHFVTELRYGRGFSAQVVEGSQLAVSVSVVGAVGYALLRILFR
ncbi:phospholipase A and acyltransferase 3-like isoform X2 [Lepisosteus oculatus]|uniref:phospholipase A and acyltransferase 3-like isoform X2 n=1 Tax=Lepisosteus oculatus TaxID=7918 RepID=UPI00371AA723